ncbi:MAG: hypothetical protein JEZ08_04040 [Clostridiales bacterium]|nr:hypothetical protein [Clostridiales bacterium]
MLIGSTFLLYYLNYKMNFMEKIRCTKWGQILLFNYLVEMVLGVLLSLMVLFLRIYIGQIDSNMIFVKYFISFLHGPGLFLIYDALINFKNGKSE